ncbi:MAG: IS1 family transposase [Hyphomicrobiaceae bacterium]
MALNKLPIAKRVQILSMLVEGSSMSSISRVCDVSINTVAKILEDAGKVCMAFHDETVRNVRSKRVQVDEIWSFTAVKQKNVANRKKPIDGAGDTWTWTAIDADSKLIVQWYVGDRSGETAKFFIDRLAERLANRIQLTSDGHKAYLEAIEGAFGADVDNAMLQRIYGATVEGQKRYSPAECIGTQTKVIEGAPDTKHISTSYVARSNLTLRMHNRRFTRLTNAFSKKFESHVNMIALYTVWYDWVGIHKTLKVTTAMAAGLTGKLMSVEDVIALIDATVLQPGRSKVYKKRS